MLTPVLAIPGGDSAPLPATPEQVGLSSSSLQHLKTQFQDEIDAQRLPGGVLLVARHGRLAMVEALGMLDPVSGVAMSPDAIFRIYSMTKPIVSVAVMVLVEQGKLRLDEEVAAYLPEYASQLVAPPEARTVSPSCVSRPALVRDLLRHTAGLTYEFLGNSMVQRLYAQVKIGSLQRSSAEFSRQLAALPLMCEPGTLWEYSRATDVLGCLIEAVSGQSLGNYLSKVILQPLGMVDTGFAVAPANHGRIAQAHASDPAGGVQMRLWDARHPPSMESGGSGLVSTAMDYARFLQCLLNRGKLGSAQLLSEPTVQAMTSDQLGEIPVHPGASRDLLPPGYGFGFGFAVCKSAVSGVLPNSPGAYFWGGMAGTTFFVDPSRDMLGCLMILAPNQREHYRKLFCQGVYAALRD